MKPKTKTPRSPKRRYHIRNWQEYNRALVQRGSLTLWVEAAALAGWLHAERSGKPGVSFTYSEVAIATGLTLKAGYGLPLRAAQGFLASVLQQLGHATLPVPDYSTLSRRQQTLSVALPRPTQSQGLHLVVDSTGCKLYGEGEWKVRQHGYSKRRTWRKLHLGVDAATGEIVAAMLTTNDVADSAVLGDLLEQVPEPIAQLSGDGGYDQRACYALLRQRQQAQEQPLRVTIPPRHGARIWQHGNCQAERLARDENLRRVRQVGRQRWKAESGYHRRRLAQTTMSRCKGSFGGKLSARQFEAQATEAFMQCAVLNKMIRLGRPESYAV